MILLIYLTRGSNGPLYSQYPTVGTLPKTYLYTLHPKTLPSIELSTDIGLHVMGDLLLLCVEKHLNNHTLVNHMSYSLLSLETQKTRATF